MPSRHLLTDPSRATFEQLEPRLLMSGSVMAEVVDGSLLIDGDAVGNSIRIDQTSLPVYKVTALFESTPLVQKAGRHSGLVVSWFQGHTKPLLSKENRKVLKELDWDGQAKDFN